MLGDKIAEETGKITGVRVLPGEGGRYVKIEISFQAAGKLLGVNASDTGTYVAYERLPGVLYGEGQGIIATESGEGIIWHGFGVGRMVGPGMAAQWRACVTYQTSSQKLARLNTVLGVLEHQTDEQGNVTTKAWEWK
ncbi:MAG: hypothetical protein HY683_00980 [Chloroflexi bacterium]|nr:hypothetical protein [Chloroflexota bacterium]